MSARFALDQSVVYGALCGRERFMRAVVAIIARCDTIVWDREWHRRCYSVICREADRESTTAFQLLLLIRRAFAWAGKMDQAALDPPPLADERGIHTKDLWLVRLAVAANACVVAEDAPLIEALRAKGIPCALPSEVVET